MEPDPKQFAERLVSAMPDAIIYADAEGVIRFWNGGATRIFGFIESEAIGQSRYSEGQTLGARHSRCVIS